MRRVGVPVRDDCDGSFRRSDTENSWRDRRTGRETGSSPPNFLPRSHARKSQGGRGGRPRRRVWVLPALCGQEDSLPGQSKHNPIPTGQLSKQVEVLPFLCIMCGQRELKTPVGGENDGCFLSLHLIRL